MVFNVMGERDRLRARSLDTQTQLDEVDRLLGIEVGGHALRLQLLRDLLAHRHPRIVAGIRVALNSLRQDRAIADTVAALLNIDLDDLETS